MKKYYVGVKALIRNEKGEYLFLVKQNGKIDLPGGRLEETETQKETLLRELNEELPSLVVEEMGRISDTGVLPSADIDLFLVVFPVRASFPYGIHLSEEHKSYFWKYYDNPLASLTQRLE